MYYIYIWWDLPRGAALYYCRGWEAPRSALHSLEMQGSCGVGPVWVQRPWKSKDTHESRVASGVNPSPRAGEDLYSSSSGRAGSKRGQIVLSPSFSSIHALNELNDPHPLWGEPTTLVSPQTQMLIWSQSPSQEHPEIMFNLDTYRTSQIDTWN